MPHSSIKFLPLLIFRRVVIQLQLQLNLRVILINQELIVHGVDVDPYFYFIITIILLYYCI